MRVYEILEKIAKTKKKSDKIAILKQHNNNWALKDIIKGSMDSTIKWSIPDGEPPYTPSDEHNNPTDLTRHNKKFAYFVQGVHMDTPKYKKERLFLQMLEGVHPNDARLVIGMINKQQPKGLTRPVVEEAYPGLLAD